MGPVTGEPRPDHGGIQTFLIADIRGYTRFTPSWDLKRFGLVDTLVSERTGWLRRLADVMAGEIDFLLDEPIDQRLARRRRRFPAMGNFER